MAIAVRASGSTTVDTSGSTGSASTAVTKPSGTAAGDLMIASETVEAPSLVGLTTPTGWTVVGTATTGTQITGVYRRIAQAGDTSWTFPRTGGSGTASIGICLQTFTGCDGTTPIDATGTASTNTTGTSITANAVTIATSGAWEVLGFGCSNSNTAAATGFTVLTFTAVNEQSAILYNQTPKSTGSTGTVSVTTGTNAGGMMCVPFALRPASAGVTEPFPAGYFQGQVSNLTILRM